ncbi:MAG TPA: efflux RND transporter periplasmic adaptor subunit [Rhizobiales bacterium]|nr:macrolide export protein MacA [bacterium BMS3Bbin10]HDO52878.1 efflux RND transporter periplasmic adaptor subunit [Hyphomicrobiales bacterium]
MRRHSLKIFLGLAAALVLVLAGWVFAANRPVKVQVAHIEQNVPVKVFGLGTVEARILSKVGFQAGAALQELMADHGDVVKKGDVLARLNAREQEAKVKKARAGILSAEAGLKEARANVIKARAVLAQRKASNKRKQALVIRGTVSEETAEEAQRDEDIAGADHAVALSSVDVARARLADAGAQYDIERTILDHHTLAAPFDAMVVERHKELGDVVNPGEAIFTLVDPASVWALAYVDEARAGPVKVGQRAEVRLRSLPQKIFPARVVRIGIESDRVSEERRVYVKCEQCPEKFHLGEQAEILITVATLKRATLVPEAAIDGFDGYKGRIWGVEDGVLYRYAATFGHRTADARLEIIEGLPPGAQAVTRMSAALREGRRAWIANRQAQ